ncbi:hypothetical protein HYH03_014672 [Edaphochlamys debaryana]|uniref:Uncharacterized protein n=1 Tax=Edaphochlamys debaryana TaxID=47281 RepID=A0A836BS37_9CHLO|nr:hypothetical protein HYH03_014672 [Edaphochlamys debaryana]|eukprot:KAG2486747.1 hypothetical protein HYH03_014672 [Edaphochlamys debaryana]
MALRARPSLLAAALSSRPAPACSRRVSRPQTVRACHKEDKDPPANAGDSARPAPTPPPQQSGDLTEQLQKIEESLSASVRAAVKEAFEPLSAKIDDLWQQQERNSQLLGGVREQQQSNGQLLGGVREQQERNGGLLGGVLGMRLRPVIEKEVGLKGRSTQLEDAVSLVAAALLASPLGRRDPTPLAAEVEALVSWLLEGHRGFWAVLEWELEGQVRLLEGVPLEGEDATLQAELRVALERVRAIRIWNQQQRPGQQGGSAAVLGGQPVPPPQASEPSEADISAAARPTAAARASAMTATASALVAGGLCVPALLSLQPLARAWGSFPPELLQVDWLAGAASAAEAELWLAVIEYTGTEANLQQARKQLERAATVLLCVRNVIRRHHESAGLSGPRAAILNLLNLIPARLLGRGSPPPPPALSITGIAGWVTDVRTLAELDVLRVPDMVLLSEPAAVAALDLAVRPLPRAFSAAAAAEPCAPTPPAPGSSSTYYGHWTSNVQFLDPVLPLVAPAVAAAGGLMVRLAAECVVDRVRMGAEWVQPGDDSSFSVDEAGEGAEGPGQAGP